MHGSGTRVRKRWAQRRSYTLTIFHAKFIIEYYGTVEKVLKVPRILYTSKEGFILQKVRTFEIFAPALYGERRNESEIPPQFARRCMAWPTPVHTSNLLPTPIPVQLELAR